MIRPKRVLFVVGATFLFALAPLAAGCDLSGGAGEPSTTSTRASHSAMKFSHANFALLVAHPNRYRGARVNIVGKVLSVQRDPLGVAFQMYAESRHDQWITIVYASPGTAVYSRPGTAVGKGAYVRVLGIVDGSLNVTDESGATVIAPTLAASLVRQLPVR